MVIVYVLEGIESAKRYVGITNNIVRRLKEHSVKSSKGSQIIGEFKLIHTESFADYGLARVREKFLKSGQGREWLKRVRPGPP